MCPTCGKPMRKIIARKGRNAGNAFWSCTGYPDCKGTRPCFFGSFSLRVLAEGC